MARDHCWFGMEDVIATYLSDHAIPHIRDSEQIVGVRGIENWPIDFILTGPVPTFIEIKYSRYGNILPTKRLAASAVKAFSRCRFILLVVGDPAGWEVLEPYVSVIKHFSHSSEFAVSDNEFKSKVAAFVTAVLSKVEDLRVLSRSDPTQVEVWSSFEADYDMSGGNVSALGIEQLFSQRVPECITTVAASFSAIMGPSALPTSVIDHELSNLRVELRCNHHTACALRIGRCLELCTYGFAHRLGIAAKTGQYRSLLDVQNRIIQLERLIEEFGKADRQNDTIGCTRQRDELANQIISTQGALGMLLVRLDQIHTEEKIVCGPDNLQTILRRAQRTLQQLGSSDESRKRLGQLIKRNEIKSLSDFRNFAAHGDPDFQTRETTHDELVKHLFRLAEFVQELANIIDVAGLPGTETQTHLGLNC